MIKLEAKQVPQKIRSNALGAWVYPTGVSRSDLE